MLPIPMLILGALLYADLSNPAIMYAFSSALLEMIYLDIYLLIIFAMIVFSLYFFPKAEVQAKTIRLIRILVTAFSWLMINSFVIFSSLTPEQASVLNKFIPAFEGNPLVFITPSLFEIPAIAIAVYMGIVAERLLLSMRGRFINHN